MKKRIINLENEAQRCLNSSLVLKRVYAENIENMEFSLEQLKQKSVELENRIVILRDKIKQITEGKA